MDGYSMNAHRQWHRRELRAHKLLEPTDEGELRAARAQSEKVAAESIAHARSRRELLLLLRCEMHGRA